MRGEVFIIETFEKDLWAFGDHMKRIPRIKALARSQFEDDFTFFVFLLTNLSQTSLAWNKRPKRSMTLNWLFLFFALLFTFLVSEARYEKISQRFFTKLFFVAWFVFFVVSIVRLVYSALKSSLNNFLINIQFSRYLINVAWSRNIGIETKMRRDVVWLPKTLLITNSKL